MLCFNVPKSIFHLVLITQYFFLMLVSLSDIKWVLLDSTPKLLNHIHYFKNHLILGEVQNNLQNC